MTAAQAAARPRMKVTTRGAVLLLARGLIALLFVLAGPAKALGPAPYLAHMAQVGVPGVLLWGVIALELGAGLAVLLGWRLRWSAGALAVFCIATALIFHTHFADKAERTSFFKDLAISGGLMTLAASAP